MPSESSHEQQLTLNKLTVDKILSSFFFAKGVDPDTVVLMAARASRLENQDAIDTAIVRMLADPKEARAGIQEIHFLPFNPTNKRTALTYLDRDGKMHRVSKGALEQILNLARNKSDIERRVHAVIDKFAERGLRSLAVAYQEVPEVKEERWCDGRCSESSSALRRLRSSSKFLYPSPKFIQKNV